MNKINISNTETMKCKIKYLFIILLAFTQTSCKSDKEKADDFINTLSKETEVLLALPNSSPSCIFFTDGRIIKSHNINNDSTKTIPYGNIIDEDAVEEILAGDSNIIVITKDEENTKNAYIYDIGQQKFSEIKPFKANQKVTETKLSKSNKTISFIYDQSISNVAILDWSEYYEHDFANKKQKEWKSQIRAAALYGEAQSTDGTKYPKLDSFHKQEALASGKSKNKENELTPMHKSLSE